MNGPAATSPTTVTARRLAIWLIALLAATAAVAVLCSLAGQYTGSSLGLYTNLRSTWHSPHGEVAPPVNALQIHFPVPVAPDSFTVPEDVIGFDGPDGPIAVTGHSWPDPQSLLLRFGAQSTPGDYVLTLGGEILQAGTRTPVLVASSARFDADAGHYAGTLAVFTDIAELKQVEEAVRESEERLQRLSEATVEGVILAKQGKILAANHVFATMFGYELAQVFEK